MSENNFDQTINMLKAEPYINRIYSSLEEGNFSEADKYCDLSLEVWEENPHAYLGKLMVCLKVTKKKDLERLIYNFGEHPYYLKALKYSSPHQAVELQNILIERHCNYAAYLIKKLVEISNSEISYDNLKQVDKGIELIEEIEKILVGIPDGKDKSRLDSMLSVHRMLICDLVFAKAKILSNDGENKKATEMLGRIIKFDTNDKYRKLYENCSKIANREIEIEQKQELERAQAEGRRMVLKAKKNATKLMCFSVIVTVLCVFAGVAVVLSSLPDLTVLVSLFLSTFLFSIIFALKRNYSEKQGELIYYISWISFNVLVIGIRFFKYGFSGSIVFLIVSFIGIGFSNVFRSCSMSMDSKRVRCVLTLYEKILCLESLI